MAAVQQTVPQGLCSPLHIVFENVQSGYGGFVFVYQHRWLKKHTGYVHYSYDTLGCVAVSIGWRRHLTPYFILMLYLESTFCSHYLYSQLKTVSHEEFFPGNFGVGGVINLLGKKNVSYEEMFRNNLLAQNFLRKFWLEFFQPRKF